MKPVEAAVPTTIFPTTDTQTEIKKTADGFQNFAARLGVGSGKGCDGSEDNLLSQGHYEPNPITRNRLQLEWAYRGSWIAGKVIDCPAEDMTREGILLTTNEQAEVIPDFMVHMSRLQIMTSFCKAIRWGRLYGGAIGVMQIDGQKLAAPLNIDAVGEGQFKGITTYDRWQLAPSLTELIDSGPNMGLPKFYDIVSGLNINDPGQAPGGDKEQKTEGRVRVHHSRVFRTDGIELPFFQAITEMMWGESILERLWDRLIAFDDATMNVAGLIHRANLRTVKFAGLREIMAAGGEAQAGLEAQVEWMRKMQSNEGITAMDKEDEFASTSYSFAGIPETVLQMGQQVSGAADIPLVRLFCQSPQGLNATGDSDLRMYYDGIKARQETKMRNPMETVLKVMWRSFTGKPSPKDLSFKFIPLYQLSGVDKANVAKTNTDTIVAAHQEGGIDTATMMKELKQNSSETGLFTHITDEAIKEAENEEPPEPDQETNPDETEPSSKADKSSVQKEKQKKKSDASDSAWAKIKRWLAPVKEPVVIQPKKPVRVTDAQKIKDWLAKQK